MLPILSAVPDSIKKQILDGLVNFIASQAEKLASEKVAGQIRKMSSQHEFAKAVEKAIDGGTKRFATEYAFQDNELVQAISNSQDFWNSKIVQLAISKPDPGGSGAAGRHAFWHPQLHCEHSAVEV